MLKINNLSVEAGKKKVINKLSLAINRGEIHILMGPNGAGKTSLVMAVMGHPGYEVKGGQITVDNKDVSQLTPDKRAKLGLFISFQKPVAIPGVSVRNLLRLVVKEQLEEKILQNTTRLNIKDELLTRSLNQDFSGGEAKKMELFQATMLSPKFLILDEVDSGLDVDSLRLVVANIRQMVKKSDAPGILLITHNPRILKFIKPDRIHVLIRGCIAKSGGPEIGEIIEKKGYQWLIKN